MKHILLCLFLSFFVSALSSDNSLGSPLAGGERPQLTWRDRIAYYVCCCCKKQTQERPEEDDDNLAILDAKWEMRQPSKCLKSGK